MSYVLTPEQLAAGYVRLTRGEARTALTLRLLNRRRGAGRYRVFDQGQGELTARKQGQRGG